MSKRFIFRQQNGERKKARLDVSISDHDFPLSQNISSNKEKDIADNWGDENDDEILLLASQACEQAYIDSDINSLPDYTLCMQPSSTSTQMYNQPGHHSSTTEFTFKKPTAKSHSIVTTNLKSKCDRISSPLPGISKVIPKLKAVDHFDKDLIFSDKIFKGQDADYVYRQLLILQEENTKLKSENGKLSEKCVTKEGEASILRTQLKSCQAAVDNARLDRIKAQEKVQLEWTEKLTAANNQLRDLTTQLDFKNLEIISVKEKCRMLESSKVKLTQVSVPSSDISHRHNGTLLPQYDVAQQARRIKTVMASVQTENKCQLLKLNKSYRLVYSGTSKLNEVLPLILETTVDQHSILDCNEKLQSNSNFAISKCRVFSTFHRLPPKSAYEVKNERAASITCIYKDLSSVAMLNEENLKGRYFDILNTVKTSLMEVQKELEYVSQRLTTAFQRDMDERYIESSALYVVVKECDLLCGRSLYKHEQAIVARRMTAILSTILEIPQSIKMLNYFEAITDTTESTGKQLIDVLCRICSLLDSNSSAVLYSGLLLSVTNLVNNLYAYIVKIDHKKIVEIVKYIITCQAMPFVYKNVLQIVRKMALKKEFLYIFCQKNNSGNLRIDYDQGVLLYKKDSCLLQVLLKQIEICVKCIEKQKLCEEAVLVTQNLLGLHSNICFADPNLCQEKRCDCQQTLAQIIIYALRVCAGMLKNKMRPIYYSELLALCRCGIQVVYQCSLRDAEFSLQLLQYEGYLIEFCELMKSFEHSDIFMNMLSDLTGAFQSSSEEMPSYDRQAWIKSFDTFSLAD